MGEETLKICPLDEDCVCNGSSCGHYESETGECLVENRNTPAKDEGEACDHLPCPDYTGSMCFDCPKGRSMLIPAATADEIVPCALAEERYCATFKKMERLVGKVDDLKAKLNSANAVVEWYAERARSLSGWDRKTPTVKLEAIVTELCLDGGKRAAALSAHNNPKKQEPEEEHFIKEGYDA